MNSDFSQNSFTYANPKNNPDSMMENENKENNSSILNTSQKSHRDFDKTAIKDMNEIPVGQKSKFLIEEYPENFQQPLETQPNENDSLIPLIERLKSKIWKNRQAALDELIKIFSNSIKNDPIFSEYIEEFFRLAADSNLIAQDKALDAFYLLLDKANIELIKNFNRKDFMKLIIEKGYCTGKNNLKDRVSNIINWFFEKVDKKSVIEIILECFPHKNQKVIIAAIEITFKLLANYGAKKLFFLKDLIPEMEKLSSSSNSLIRNLSLDFYKEAYKWLGESLLLFTNNLKKNIKQDLEKFIEEWPKSTIMTPLILIDNEEFDPNNNKQKQQNNNNENDMFDILEGVDIFNKFNDNWCEKVLNQAKWNEKKELLDEFITAANVPKLQNSNYYPILSMVKKILNDSNINVMCCGIKILGILAKGLRKAFQSPARNFFPLLLSKFKDKKTFIIDETHKSLENFLFCLNSFDEVLEDFKEALHEKVLGLKFNLLIWFDKFLEKLLKSSQKSLTNIKTVGPLIKNVLDDGSAEVRDYASKILGKIKAVYGKDFIPGFFADIQLNKLQKIDDAEEKFKATSNFNEFKQNIVPLQKIGDNNNNKMKKKTNDKNEPNFKNKQKIEGNIKNSIEEENNSSFKLSLEASENLLKDNNFEFFLKSFETNSVWTEKNEAIKEIQRSYLQKLEENPLLIEAITLIIKNRFKEWKESNVNLVKEFYNLLIFLSNSKKNLISKRIANILISFFIEKMQDGNKYSELLWSFIINILNYTHPKQLILEFLMKIQEIYGNDIKKANAKTITELYGFFLKLIDLVSLQNLPLKEIIDLSKFLSTSPNPNIKQSVSNMLKCLYSHVGQQFTLFLKDMNPSLLKTLHNEFSKVKILDDHEKKPKIKIFEENEKVGVKKPLDLLDSLPRTDISNEVNKQLKKLNDPDWKIQKEALEEIDKILTLNPRISLENLSDFSNCLKNGLKDKKNKCLLRVYINLTSKFCESSGREFFNFGKILIQHLLSSLSDKQALVRCDIVNALHKFENNLGSEFILNHISIFLMNNENKESQSVEMKQEILNWLLKNANLLVKFPNLKSLLPIFLNMLAEKNKEIRILTDQLVEKIILAIGPNLFAESLKNMKPSLIQQIKPLFEKYNVSYKASLTVFPEKEIKANEIDLEKTKVNEPHHLLLENKLEETRPARNISKNKKIRLEQDNITPWPINEINDDLIDELKENLSGYYSESNIRKMFSFDVKKNIEIIMFLKENVHTKEILSNSDLIFKWLLFKLMNHVNKEFIEEILELIISVLQNMIQSQSPLFESEIRIILSCLKKVKENNSFDLTEKITKIDQILHGLFNNDYIANFWGKTKNTKTFNINSNNEAGTFSTLPQPKENYDFDKPATSKRNSLPGGGANNNSLDYINMNNYSESPSPNQPRNLTKKMILQNNLEVLNWSSIPGKIDALLNIYNFLSEETPENKIIIQSEATNIAKVIGFLFQPEVEMDNKLNSNTPYQFVNYLVKISMKIFSSKFLLDNVSYDVLSELIEKILQRLLIEDANKGDKNNSSYSENNDDIPIKNLNSLMLKILETCSPNNIFQILFDLLIKYRKFCIFSKFIALVIKCILKLTKVMETLLSNLDVGLIFLKFHLYICEFYNENLKNNEDLGVKTIKTIINEIIKIKGASVLDYYHIIANHDKNDKYIFRWIELMLSHQINNQNTSKDKKISPLTSYSTIKASPENCEISNLVDKIKNNDSFGEGVNELYGFLIKDPNFNVNFLTGYLDSNTFEKVKFTLQNLQKLQNDNEN